MIDKPIIHQVGMDEKTIYITFEYKGGDYVLEDHEDNILIKNKHTNHYEEALLKDEFIQLVFTLTEEKTKKIN